MNYLPSTVTDLQEFDAPNIAACPNFNGYTNLTKVNIGCSSISFSATGSSQGFFRNCTQLVQVLLPNCISLSSSTINHHEYKYCGLFYGCTSLSSVTFPRLLTLTNYARTPDTGMFHGSGLVSFFAPELITISDSSNFGSGSGAFAGSRLSTFSANKLKYITGSEVSGCGAFCNCTRLTSIDLPSIESITNYQFNGCTGLESVQLGSVGHPVTSLGAYTFNGCTQSGLTITVYTADGLPLSGSPWGATNTQPTFVQA